MHFTASLKKGQNNKNNLILNTNFNIQYPVQMTRSTHKSIVNISNVLGQFDGNGTEGVDAIWGGYECLWVGNLNCTDFEFQCEGE